LFAALLGGSVAMADINEIENDQTHDVDCEKDPTVNLVGNGTKVTLNGVCKLVNISGNDSTVTGSVIKVQISGNKNTLTLEAIDSILVSGNNNSISYKATVTKTKKKTGVLNSGKGNKIGKVK
jgi:hypothetical protein